MELTLLTNLGLQDHLPVLLLLHRTDASDMTAATIALQACKLCALHGHTYHDVAASIEFAVNVDLGKGWPLAVLFHPHAQGVVFKNVDCLVRRPNHIEDLLAVRCQHLAAIRHAAHPA